MELMNQVLVDDINGTVGPNDTLYHLGDAAWHGSERAFWDKIRCKVVLLFGNHDDRKWYEGMKSCGVHCPEFHDYLEIPLSIKKGKIVLSHYPMESWNGERKGWYCLHGHGHSDLSTSIGRRRLDVGVDVIGYKPLSVVEVIDFIEKRNSNASKTN